jgi:AcrR family transcriptional regulator
MKRVTSLRRRRVEPRKRGRPAGRRLDDGVIADRETLLAAAERLIRKRGPGVSLDAIAVEAGVTKPILYRGVGDRDALVQALALRLSARMAAAMTKLVEDASGPRDSLHRLVGGYLEGAAAERHLYLYVTAGGTSEDRVRQSLLLADDAARRFGPGIAAYRTSRGADASVATVWSYAFVGALHFVTLWWLRESALDIDAVAEQLTELLWHGLSGEDAPKARPRARRGNDR